MAGDDGRCGVAVAVVLCAGWQNNQDLRENNQDLRKIRPALGSFSAPFAGVPPTTLLINSK